MAVYWVRYYLHSSLEDLKKRALKAGFRLSEKKSISRIHFVADPSRVGDELQQIYFETEVGDDTLHKVEMFKISPSSGKRPRCLRFRKHIMVASYAQAKEILQGLMGLHEDLHYSFEREYHTHADGRRFYIDVVDYVGTIIGIEAQGAEGEEGFKKLVGLRGRRKESLYEEHIYPDIVYKLKESGNPLRLFRKKSWLAPSKFH